jgi:hypothetical protein
MKKTIVSTLALGLLSFSAFSQGSVALTTQGLANGVNVTLYGGGSDTDPNIASSWAIAPNATYQIWYVATATAGQLNAINALNDVSGGATTALADLATDGFTQVASGSGTATDGSFAANGNGGNVVLSGVPTSTDAYLALVIIEGSGGSSDNAGVSGAANWEGVLAFANNTGGNLAATPTPGFPAALTGWGNLGVNLVLSPVSVPEPGTLALAGLGGLASLVAMRRRKAA